MGQLDASIVTVAFPTLQRVFHASVASVTWVGLSYLIVLVAGVTAVGRLADMVGRKLLYTYGFVVFILGSALCALAPTLGSLDAFRVFQAIGAAMLQANSVAIIYLAMPKQHLGRGIGLQGAAQALGLALGPTVGGLLLAAGGWRLIFFVNVPAGILGTMAAWVFLPRSRDLQVRSPYDWTGLALFVPTVVSALVAISFGGHWGWTSVPLIGLFVTAACCGALFIARERRVATPMLDLSLFHRAPFTIGIASGLLSFVVLFGTMLAVPFFLERGRGSNASHAGLVLTVLPLALGCVAPIAGKLGERTGGRPLTVSGMALCSVVLGLLGTSRPSGWLLPAELCLVGVGLGLFISPNNTVIMSTSPRSQAGVASGVLNMTRGLGTTLGLALTGLVLGVAAVHQSPRLAADHGFEEAALLLSSVALIAAILSAFLPGSLKMRRRDTGDGGGGRGDDGRFAEGSADPTVP